ncbi:glycosyltransferase family 4 protein [Streptomyces sp. RFCAC02]|uniref:glycosyltransferase family 4 protein n=1 Tax=Streptomyces sp. RFCAC02 TaxID=2499143 RepID=UPI00101EC5B1|nr:glycosyltransferase family 4 protein [Streptomyces sp. RFCAC02]
MHIAVFVENRNGVDLTRRIMAAPRAAGHTFSVFTADVNGEVARWIAEEADRRLPGVPVRNLFEVGEAMSDDEFAQAVTVRADRFARERGIDRVILFNDQSRRGKKVTEALTERVPVVLVQDGHLDFHYKQLGSARRDQNWYYGASRPAAVCVWGPAMAQHVSFRTPEAGPPVHITGALGHSDDPVLLTAARSGVHRTTREADAPLRIIVLDQPLGDQGKMPRPAHREELAQMIEALREHGSVDVKPHPSTQAAHLTWLSTGLPDDVTALDADTLLDADALGEYDLAVTFFSTTYLQTLRAGVPLVMYNPQALNIVFPTVHHPLLRNIGTTEELSAVASRLRRSRKFLANQHGSPMEHFLAFRDDVADAIMTVVDEAEPAGPAEPGGTPAAGTGPVGAGTAYAPGASLAERALAEVERRAARPSTLAVVGVSFSYVTGVAVPVLTYTQALIAQSPVDVHYFDLAAFPQPEHAADALADAEIVLINSMAPFWRSPIANGLIEGLLDAGRRVVLYAHETEYVFTYESERSAERHAEMLKLLPRLTVLCVSKAQADMFRQLGVTDPIVIYNTVPRDIHRTRASAAVSERPRMVMVGTVQDRKGVDLFSRVAELAHARGLPWRFSWVGWKTPRIARKTLLSDRVEWMGALARDRVREELAASDVFFLSSVDDPMPLSVVEAVQHRLRIATFHRVGSREVLDGVRGYRAYTEYTPEAALDALAAVLAEDVDEERYAEVEELFDIPAFSARMSAALSLPAPGQVVAHDGEAARHRFSVAIGQNVAYRTDEFRDQLKAGREENAFRIGKEILRRSTNSTDVLIGMAEIHARHGRVRDALGMLGGAACVGGQRSRVWLEIARIAEQLGAEGRSLQRFARREALRVKVRNRASRIGGAE